MGPKAAAEALVLARQLRSNGLPVDVDGRGGTKTSLKAMLRRANAQGARLCLVLGEAELEAGIVQIKDLRARSQQDIRRDDVVQRVLETMQSQEAVGGEG
ncbi:MAG: hypothetical protein CSA75_05185 [Sorangium cellulosum]|nr:MAG: hypothetical protein CSA75_05185 [Sorangium cellulosum]